MKIAVISTMSGQPWTGSEELWADMVSVALQEEHQVALSISRWPQTPSQVSALQGQGARLMWRSLPGKLPTFNSILNRLVGRRIYLKRPRRFSDFYAIFRFRPDVICLSQGWAYEFRDHPDLVSRLYASTIPLVVISHANIDGIVTRDTREDGRPFFGRAAKLAFVSQGNLKATERQVATHLPHSVVVRNPVNMKDLSIVPWPKRADDEPWNLACVGRLDCGPKAQDVLLEALGAPVWRERNWKLRFFGSGEASEKAYIDSLIDHYGLRSHVEFGGYVPDVRTIWSQHHLLVMPSRAEGMPLAIVEAMLCGRATLATDVAGHREWIEEGKNGFIAEAPTAHSLGKALERAWQERDNWRALGEAAHEAACQRYDKTPGKTLLQLLKSVAAAGQSEPDL